MFNKMLPIQISFYLLVIRFIMDWYRVHGIGKSFLTDKYVNGRLTSVDQLSIRIDSVTKAMMKGESNDAESNDT